MSVGRNKTKTNIERSTSAPLSIINPNSNALSLLSMRSTKSMLRDMDPSLKQRTMSVTTRHYSDADAKADAAGNVHDTDNQTPCFQNLPFDVQGHILSMLPLRDGLKGRQLSKTSKNINTFTVNQKKCLFVKICSRYNKVTVGWFWLNTNNDLIKQMDKSNEQMINNKQFWKFQYNEDMYRYDFKLDKLNINNLCIITDSYKYIPSSIIQDDVELLYLKQSSQFDCPYHDNDSTNVMLSSNTNSNSKYTRKGVADFLYAGLKRLKYMFIKASFVLDSDYFVAIDFNKIKCRSLQNVFLSHVHIMTNVEYPFSNNLPNLRHLKLHMCNVVDYSDPTQHTVTQFPDIPMMLTNNLTSFEYQPFHKPFQTFVAPNLRQLHIAIFSTDAQDFLVPSLDYLHFLKVEFLGLGGISYLRFSEDFNTPLQQLEISHVTINTLPDSVRSNLVHLSITDSVMTNIYIFHALTHLTIENVHHNAKHLLQKDNLPSLTHLTITHTNMGRHNLCHLQTATVVPTHLVLNLEHRRVTDILSQSLTQYVEYFRCSCYFFGLENLSSRFPKLRVCNLTVSEIDRDIGKQLLPQLEELTVVYHQPKFANNRQVRSLQIPICGNRLKSINFVNVSFMQNYDYPKSCKRIVLNNVQMPSWPEFPADLDELHLVKTRVSHNYTFQSSDLPTTLKVLVLDIRTIETNNSLNLSRFSQLDKLSIICDVLDELPIDIRSFVELRIKNHPFRTFPRSLESIPRSLESVDIVLFKDKEVLKIYTDSKEKHPFTRTSMENEYIDFLQISRREVCFS